MWNGVKIFKKVKKLWDRKKLREELKKSYGERLLINCGGLEEDSEPKPPYFCAYE